MTLLPEILESMTTVSISDINEKTPKLRVQVEAVKNEAVAYTEDVYEKFIRRPKIYAELQGKALECQENLEVLQEKAEYVVSKDLIKTEDELRENIETLELTKIKMQLVSNILNIVKLDCAFNDEFEASNFIKCVDLLSKLRHSIDAVPQDERLDIMDQLNQEVNEHKVKLDNKMKTVFTNNIEFVPSVPGEQFITKLRVKNVNEEMEMVLSAYYAKDDIILPLNKLTKRFWDDLFVPIVDQNVLLSEESNGNYNTLEISIVDASGKSNYETVFANLKKALVFLKKYFPYKVADDLTALSYIGNDIRDNLSELIIKNCLRDTIPSREEDLPNYKSVIEATEELEKYLLEANIFTTSTVSILEYASKVDLHFINKKCNDYINTATEIMKKDIHDIFEVGVLEALEYPSEGNHSDGHFPLCSVSKNVQELLDFTEDILKKATTASPECSGRLFTTVGIIIVKYSIFVPEFHKQYLASLPQQVAIFLNNCHYITHTLTKWNKTYCQKLRHDLVSCDLNADAIQIPVVGLDIFNKYIDSQVKQAEDIMNEAQLDDVTIEKLDPKTEKCVRQCLRQLELLRTVWHKVLPREIYNKNVGFLVNQLCEILIRKIVKFEDISAALSSDMADLIKLVLTRAPKLFSDPNEITLFVQRWYKLKELQFILTNSLADINDRWADGKGPLAIEFEKTELKNLIKALFQNTDRRAAVLAKIS